jgi:hypothetical protein
LLFLCHLEAYSAKMSEMNRAIHFIFEKVNKICLQLQSQHLYRFVHLFRKNNGTWTQSNFDNLKKLYCATFTNALTSKEVSQKRQARRQEGGGGGL